MPRSIAWLAIGVVAAAGAVAAQPLSRLKGRIVSESGAAIEADVRIEAVLGPRGDSYVGQRIYTVRSNAKGEWTLIGFKAGAWMFAVAPETQLIDAVVLPINVFVPAGSGMAGLGPSWRPVLKPAPVPAGAAGDWLTIAAAAARQGDSARASETLSVVPPEAGAPALAAAGRIGLWLHDPGLARTLFTRALALDPASFRATLGFGSAALMLGDFSAASKAFKAARDLTHDSDERSYLTAAIADLSRMDISGH
ncbi:MAG TPA: tetratricopeptide repeat protein [Vicinamibacterales bacterium]|nr:tetratricopeptide repeat protein [Vicinamibacterales bacterium]